MTGLLIFPIVIIIIIIIIIIFFFFFGGGGYNVSDSMNCCHKSGHFSSFSTSTEFNHTWISNLSMACMDFLWN